MTISRFNTPVRTAQKIEFLSNEDLQNMSKDVERLLKAKLKESIIHSSNTIILKFFNKSLEFTIKSISSNSTEDIVQKFSQIQITDDEFYYIDSSTLLKVIGNNDYDSISNEKTVKFTLNQVGGLDETIKDITKWMEMALGIVETNSKMKISRAILVHGVAGTGKTMLCQALAESFPTAQKITIDSWKIFSKFYGESETNLKRSFDEAFICYPTPTVIIFDEISNICPKNDNTDAVRRISSLLGSLLDSLHVKRNASRVFVIANTISPNDIDPAIRRSGRFDYEVEIPVPNSDVRQKILTKMLVHQKQLTPPEIHDISKRTHGFVGADLDNLIKKSTGILKKEANFSLNLSYESILENLSTVKPSALRELLIEKPNVRWSEIGGQKDLKLKLKQIVEWPISHPEAFERLGIKAPRGLLMFGPPGNSKTMIAKALATESNLNFISIKGSDLFSMWVGESEKAVRDLFVKARQLSPCIVFFDEIDAIGGERSADSGSSVKERVLAQILTEIDGVNILKNVIIIAATNRPDLIDKALMRPGRLDRIVYVRLPNPETRAEIFKIKLSKIPVSGDVEIELLVDKTDGYSGAEIEAVCKEAALKALEDSYDVKQIDMKYFHKALDIVKPRTSQELLQLYSDYEKRK